MSKQHKLSKGQSAAKTARTVGSWTCDPWAKNLTSQTISHSIWEMGKPFQGCCGV